MTKRGDKYKWRIGAAPPSIDHHSLVKHQIVREYLGRYIKVLMSNYNIERLVLSIVDGFAGGGEYIAPDGKGHSPGSPQIVVDTVTEQEALLNIGREKPRKVDAKYYFVEQHPSTHAYLNALLATKYGDARLGKDIISVPGAFDALVHKINQDIIQRQGGGRAVFLLDQYSYDKVPAPLIRKIFTEVEKPEVILTFGVDSLISFLADNSQSRKKMEELGLDAHIDWASLESLRGAPPAVWRSAIQRNLAKGLIESSGATHSTIFYITPMGNSSWTYWLVHLSKNYKARDVMMELHWEMANHFSHYLEPDLFTLGYRAGSDKAATKQHDIELGEAHYFDAIASDKCKRGLGEKLVPLLFDRSDPIEFRQLTELIGSLTPATAGMIRDSLDEAVRAGELLVMSADGKTRTKGSSIKPGDRLQAKQRPLIFLS
ncbi:three-Cys-motif partner protein TcmP [Polaromonas sp.]|uniref:three-Cys-motif partner protein TcmP n=1 Tax=Polaromonas sp. TaxID=1869339 RepID=UPI003263FDE5